MVDLQKAHEEVLARLSSLETRMFNIEQSAKERQPVVPEPLKEPIQ